MFVLISAHPSYFLISKPIFNLLVSFREAGEHQQSQRGVPAHLIVTEDGQVML